MCSEPSAINFHYYPYHDIFLVLILITLFCKTQKYLVPCAVNSLSSVDRLDEPSPIMPCFLSVVTSLSSASFIPVTSCISSIHLLLGRTPLRLPSPYVIHFSNPSDRIACPKNPRFLLSAVYCSVSSSYIQMSLRRWT